MNPYFTVNDSEHFTFYRIPKLLFTDEIYQTVSTDAKMLYGCGFSTSVSGEAQHIGK